MSRPILPQMPPYQQQVPNAANVIQVSGAPSANATGNPVGTLAVDQAAGNMYAAVKNTGLNGTVTWAILGGATGAVATINSLAPMNGNIVIAGTSNQLSVGSAGSTVTLSLPSAITAPGSLTTTTSLAATTTVTAGTGLIATTGGIAATGASTINTSGSGTTQIGNGGTGAVTIGNSTGNITLPDSVNLVLGSSTGTKIGTATTQLLGFYNKDPVAQQVQGATLTNNVTAGGSANTLANYTDLTVYGNDAAAIRNDIYQLGQTLKTVVDALRLMGLLS